MYIIPLATSLRKDFKVAAQNAYIKISGAFTGEIRSVLGSINSRLLNNNRIVVPLSSLTLKSPMLSSVGYRNASEGDKHPALICIRSGNPGHSERRTLFNEDSKLVAQKTRAAIDAGLSVILCIGETLAEREAGKCTEVVEAQLQEVVQVTNEADWGCVSCYRKRGLMSNSCVILAVKS